MIVTNELYQSNFTEVMFYDNVYCVTLKLKPGMWAHQEMFENEMSKYCNKRAIELLLVAEVGAGNNLHYHGLIGYPFDHIKKRFHNWFTKYFGQIHYSDKGDAVGWQNYVFKNCPALHVRDDFIDGNGELQKPPYLFDPKYEPT